MPLNEDKPLVNATANLLPSSEVRKMVRAIRDAGVFSVQDEVGTIKAVHTATGKVVFMALQKGGSGTPWIVRTHKKLFS